MRTNNGMTLARLAAGLLLAFGLSAAALQAQAAATLTIINANAPGVGFNDATAVAPVGGNPGTTLGQQRLIAFQAAADQWGATLDSTVPILIQARFSALTCTATSAVLGSAGATSVFRDFPGALKPATWYSFALTNKLLGADAVPGSQSDQHASATILLADAAHRSLASSQARSMISCNSSISRSMRTESG